MLVARGRHADLRNCAPDSAETGPWESGGAGASHVSVPVGRGRWNGRRERGREEASRTPGSQACQRKLGEGRGRTGNGEAAPPSGAREAAARRPGGPALPFRSAACAPAPRFPPAWVGAGRRGGGSHSYAVRVPGAGQPPPRGAHADLHAHTCMPTCTLTLHARSCAQPDAERPPRTHHCRSRARDSCSGTATVHLGASHPSPKAAHALLHKNREFVTRSRTHPWQAMTFTAPALPTHIHATPGPQFTGTRLRAVPACVP